MEWINPIYSAGYWVPEMVEIAGGISGVTKASERSKEVKFNEIIEYAPNYIFIMSCGYTIDDSLREMETLLKNRELNKIPAFKKGEVYLVDANAYFTRPTTRIIEGIKLLTRTINGLPLILSPFLAKNFLFSLLFLPLVETISPSSKKKSEIFIA